jgi:sec-independent protein translocase protein TatB
MLKALNGCSGCADAIWTSRLSLPGFPVCDPTHGVVATFYKIDATNALRTQQIKSANTASTKSILSKTLQSASVGPKLSKPAFVSAAHVQLSLAFMGAHPPILLGTLGMTDTLILMVMALVVFGPRRLPQIGRQIGKLMYEFRKASNDFKFQMEEELRAAEEADRRKKEEAERERVAALAATSQASVSAPAQTVEAAADIGAVEPAAASSSSAESTYPEGYSAETPAAAPETTEPTIRPPQTGEQVSASRPDYFYEAPPDTAAEQALSEVNPEADAEANAAGFEAHAAAKPESSPAPTPAVDSPSAGLNADPTSPPKEPVSQHG